MSKERFVHYAVGDAHFDESHWKLFVQMNEIIAELRANNYNSASDKIVVLLVELTEHINEEQKIMQQVNYPFATEYVRARNIMVSEISGMHQMIAIKKQISESKISRLEDMLVKHIDMYDLPLFEFVRKIQHENNNISR